MITTTTDFVPGKKIVKILGIVRGNTVRAKSFISDFGAGIKAITGGKVKTYTNLLSKARDEALDEMLKEATKIGADAVINIRFATSSVMHGMAEILAYGTAVKLEDE